jgi:hypothetical protein
MTIPIEQAAINLGVALGLSKTGRGAAAGELEDMRRDRDAWRDEARRLP